MNAKELEQIITESVNRHTTIVMSQLWGVDEETVLERVHKEGSEQDLFKAIRSDMIKNIDPKELARRL
tara:strand:+ start:60 stop:263 length:204 start_codon:yes stop_codon:yes gene_type:complete